MIDEQIIINKIEQIKNNSKSILNKNKCIKQEQFEYFLDILIKFIVENIEETI